MTDNQSLFFPASSSSSSSSSSSAASDSTTTSSSNVSTASSTSSSTASSTSSSLSSSLLMQAETKGIPPQEKLTIKEISIPSYRVDSAEVAYYIIKVKGTFDNTWHVQKRYSQFEELHAAMSTQKHFPDNVEIPPKRWRWFVSHITREFLEERRVLLEAYLKRLLAVEDFAKSEKFISFLTSDKYTEEVKEPKTLNVDTLPDDVEITGVSIPATRQMTDHILYQIDVVNIRKRKSFSKWTVLKRFGQFYEMDTTVRTLFAEKKEVLDAMPPPPMRRAKLFQDHMDKTFVEQRRCLLENYLQKMIQVLEVVRCKEFLQFMGVNYNSDDS
eukprot:TRINITY_DN140_c0_g1_i1.p1 TRINITY_DN140_c0_g1~~TRINITY_DN140_c0_g1_i1.p1  ORF type:complete len:328 (+),score=77.87 TRINITY_DN140_c0_g1_i1:36-1019(+)